MNQQAPLEDRHLLGSTTLPSPEALKAAMPPSEDAGRTVRLARAALRRCLHGDDPRRLVVIAGPCSLHDPEAALAYADRLAPLAAQHAGELVILMRAYFEKPRTTVGWKGLVNDPHLDGSCALDEGLREARRLLLALAERGIACATEFLDPVTPAYLADLVSWAAIGARTTESQTHREMASGLSMPVGFKNGTDGGVQVALDAMVAASNRQTFLGLHADGRAAVVRTAGNPDTHVVLRGGHEGPNHRANDVARAADEAAGRGAARGVLVDCSHANSAKDFRRQREVARDVASQVRAGAPGILGVMVESHLHEGRQDWAPGAELRFGVSITDACLGFADTEDLLGELAGVVQSARPGASRVAPTPTPGRVAVA
jgi:3-deoxy-7-phosphoheptulonate synthase